jgi:hypothetical protein
LRTSGSRYAKTMYAKMWASKNKNRPVSGFFTKIPYVQVKNFIPVKGGRMVLTTSSDGALIIPNLLLNCATCKVISFTKKTGPLLFNYSINNTILPCSNSVRDLGVTLHSRLSFTDHIELIGNSSFKSLGFVLRNGKEFSDVSRLCFEKR